MKAFKEDKIIEIKKFSYSLVALRSRRKSQVRSCISQLYNSFIVADLTPPPLVGTADKGGRLDPSVPDILACHWYRSLGADFNFLLEVCV